jgi:hypothetical protein
MLAVPMTVAQERITGTYDEPARPMPGTHYDLTGTYDIRDVMHDTPIVRDPLSASAFERQHSTSVL